MAIERSAPGPGPEFNIETTDANPFGKSRTTPTDHVREAAVGHALAHPDAEIPSRLRKQIDASETHIIVERRLEEPVTFDQRVALESIKESADQQIIGSRSLTKKERVVRGVGIGVVTAGIVIPTASAAYDSATEVPGLIAERARAEVPVEIGTEEINIGGFEFTIPSVGETIERRDEQIAAAQENLDSAIDDTTRNATIAGTTLVGGLAAGWAFAKRGYDPVGPTRRFIGRRKEAAGWDELGESKADLKARYNSKPTE
jgi:hypothetical protein